MPLRPESRLGHYNGGTALPWYMVSRDGQRFLTTTSPVPPVTIPIAVLQHWTPPS